jgi:threonine synthase
VGDLVCLACAREETTGPTYPPMCSCGGLWQARDPRAYRLERDPRERFETPIWKDPHAEGLWWKREDYSRTGSFKDRGAETLIGLASRVGAVRLVVDSSGSAALAAASAAARAGLPLRVHVPAGTPAVKLSVLRDFGAEVVAGGSRSEAAQRALTEASQAFYASHVHHPAFVAGTSEAGLEALRQMPVSTASTWVLPVGNGSLLLGLWQALVETGTRGVRLVAVQAGAVAGLLRPGVSGSTRARGIAISDPARRDEVLAAIAKSEGTVLEVSEDAILAARETLWRRGAAVDIASAAALPGVEQLRTGGYDGPLLGWLTGSGHRGD